MAMLAVATVFGFLTWRKNTLKSEVACINAERIAHLTLTDSLFWPELESDASLILKKDKTGVLHMAEKPATNDAVIARFEETAKRIRQLGVKEVTILFAEEQLHQGEIVEVLRIIHTDDIGRAVKRVSE
jgi:hypothetical protein